MLKGTVKWFNGKKGFGFIEREDKEKDAFVHASAVKNAGMRFLNEGDKLEFEMEDGPKGPSAVNLKKIDQFLNIKNLKGRFNPKNKSNVLLYFAVEYNSKLSKRVR